MAYVEQGEGAPIVFLHGNPTSSYLWRDVIPGLVHKGRCIAPDLIGMGDSDKLPGDDPARYKLARHAEFLDGFLEAVGVTDDVTFVFHDWGSSLGFNWAMTHPGRVRAIAYFESITRPLAGWDDWVGSPESRAIFQDLKTPGKGEQMVLEENFFVEKIFPMAVLRDLTEEEMDEYRRPVPNPEDRLPMLVWPREIPVGGEPADVVTFIEDYMAYMNTAPGIRKLCINLDPGFVLSSNGPMRDAIRNWPDQTEITLKGIHFAQEDSGKEMGDAIAEWLD
jgi:haloalkane dehalogenase